MFKYIIVFGAFFAFASAQYYEECEGTKLAKLDKLSVVGCKDDANECILKRNSNVTFLIDFTPAADLNQVNTVVHGIIADIPIPFPVPHPDACTDTGLTCPIKSNAQSHYKTELPVLRSYPKIRVDVKWQLQNEKGEDIVCVIITAKLQ